VLPGAFTHNATVCSRCAFQTMFSLVLVYLTGATLFLSLLLSRVFYIILDFIHVQESYTALQQKTARNSATEGQVEELRKRIKELEAEERDFGE
jgi:hypothetical protein